MPAAPLPPDEEARLTALHNLGLLDTPPDPEFDALVRAAALACGVPVAKISLIDRDRQWFKATTGVLDTAETPRSAALCAYTILGDDLLEVEDALADPRFADSPLVLGAPHVRFYAGAPLRLADGSAIGSLCLVQSEPRRLNDRQRDILRSLANATMVAIESWRSRRVGRQAESALVASQARLRRLFEATPAMMHSINDLGVFLEVSDVWLAKLGYRREEVIGHYMGEYMTPESRARHREVTLPQFLRTGVAENDEYQFVRKDGQVLDVLISAVAEHDADGRLQSLSVVKDVTSWRQAQRALAAEHRRLSNIIASTGMGTWEWNPRTGEVLVNDRWAAMIGRTAEDIAPLSAQTWLDHMHPADIPRAAALIEQHLAGQTKLYEVEVRMRHRDGSWVWMLDRGAVTVWTSDGAPEWFSGTRQDIRERKAQEEALRKSEDFLDRAGRAAGVGGWELDLLTHELHWSAETRRIHGVPASFTPTLATSMDFYPAQAQAALQAAIEHTFATGEGWDLELPFIRWDGSAIWVRLVASVAFDDGKPVRVTGALQDVTDRVAERLALRQANERIKVATDSGGIGLFDWDIPTAVLTWDARMHRLYGISPDAGGSTYELWRRALHPDDRDATERKLRDAIDSSRPFDTEFRIVWPDGSVHHLRAAGRVTRDPDGRPLNMVGVNWDVTESRVLAAELTRQAERQAEAYERETALFRNSPDVLSIVGVEEEAGQPVFRFEAVSPAVVQATGWRPDALLGQRPEACLPPEAAAALLTHYRACLAARGTIRYSVTLPTQKGPREFEASLTPIHHPATGKIIRLVGASRDVTERKRLEAVEHQSHKMEAIGRLAAGVAHDFNNILQSIAGSLEMVRDEVPEGSSAHEFAQIGLHSAQRGSYLTHHLLSYARQQMLCPRVIELPALLNEIETLLARTLGPKIAVIVRADPAATVVRVDPGQIQTALLNLAINAADAMPGGGTLLIESRAIQQAGQPWVCLDVTDTGTGMDEATLARAVEPFFSTKGLNGTGLGLSMVQGFAEQSGGTLSVASILGQGTTVSLYLPAVADETRGEPAPAAPAAPKTASILLVDDNSDVLITTGAFLEKAGFKIIRAADGDQALALLADGAEIDAVVTDYAMPGMNGGDLMAEVRSTRANLPGIIISAFSDLAATEAALGAGIVTLRKPFQRDLLVGTLQSLLGWDRASEELSRSARPRRS
jgi:PAS domain S-box-containing protein